MALARYQPAKGSSDANDKCRVVVAEVERLASAGQKTALQELKLKICRMQHMAATALRNQVILAYRSLLNAQRVLFSKGKVFLSPSKEVSDSQFVQIALEEPKLKNSHVQNSNKIGNNLYWNIQVEQIGSVEIIKLLKMTKILDPTSNSYDTFAHTYPRIL